MDVLAIAESELCIFYDVFLSLDDFEKFMTCSLKVPFFL